MSQKRGVEWVLMEAALFPWGLVSTRAKHDACSDRLTWNVDGAMSKLVVGDMLSQ